MLKELETTVFATRRYGYLAEAITERTQLTLGSLNRRDFADGEAYYQFKNLFQVTDHDVVIVGGTVDNDELFEMIALGCAAQKYGARSLTFIITYYGYQTMERAVLPGEVVTAKVEARMFSAIPRTPGGNRVIILDLHKGETIHYFEGDIRSEHVYCKDVTLQMIRDLGGENFVLCGVDDGRAQWIVSLANDLGGVDVAFGRKKRSADEEKTKCTGILGNVKGRHGVIYDDMARTCGSVIEAGQAYYDAGIKSLSCVFTHGVFPKGAYERLKESGLFVDVACTDTHYRALEVTRKHSDLRVYSVANLIRAKLYER